MLRSAARCTEYRQGARTTPGWYCKQPNRDEKQMLKLRKSLLGAATVALAAATMPVHAKDLTLCWGCLGSSECSGRVVERLHREDRQVAMMVNWFTFFPGP